MRLIDADALIPQMESDANQMEDPIAIMFAYAAISDIKHAPTVDAKPVRHGHWIKPDDGCVRPFWEKYICSECLCHSGNTAYCPSCGAKMERGERWI